MKTVVQVLLNLGHGGMEAMAVSLARGLDRSRFRPVVVALDGGGEYEAELRDAGVEFYVLSGRRLFSPGFHWELRALLRRIRADVVHTHHFSPLLHSLPATRLAGVSRRVHTEHSYQYLEPRRDYRRVLRVLGAMTDSFVLVARSMQAFYHERVRVRPARLRVIPNGVDTGIFTPVSAAQRGTLRAEAGLPADALLVGTAGRFFPEKSYGTLIRGFAAFAADHPLGHLALIGDGPERASLEALVAALPRDVGSRVHFLGWRRDLANLLPLLDIFALSSRSEALPMVALEALACGVPVVATPVGDLPDLIRDGGAPAGLSFPIGDSAALGRVLAELSRDGVRNEYGRTGRNRVLQQYSRQAMVESYARTYEGTELTS